MLFFFSTSTIFVCVPLLTRIRLQLRRSRQRIPRTVRWYLRRCPRLRLRHRSPQRRSLPSRETGSWVPQSMAYVYFSPLSSFLSHTSRKMNEALTLSSVYSTAFTALTDITAGGSIGCNGVNGQTGAPVVGGSIIPYASWNATTGWDPVTGLGVPNFEKLLALALSV